MSCIRGYDLSGFIQYVCSTLFTLVHFFPDVSFVPHNYVSISFISVLIWVIKLLFSMCGQFSFPLLLHRLCLSFSFFFFFFAAQCFQDLNDVCRGATFMSGCKFPTDFCNPICPAWAVFFVCMWACSRLEFHFDSHLCGYLSLLKLLSLWSELVGCYLPCLVRNPLTALALLPCNSLRSDFKLTEWISGRIHIDYNKETTYQCLSAAQLFQMVPEYFL